MNITLGVNESKALNLQGDIFWYRSGLDFIEVRLKKGGNTRAYRLDTGQGVNWQSAGFGRFESIEVKNVSAVTQTINFEATDAEIFDNQISGQIGNIVYPWPNASMAADATIATTATDNIAAGGSRARLRIQASFANPSFLRVGPGANASTGFELPPGGYWDFDNGLAIDVYNPDPASQVYRVWEDLLS